MSIESPQLPLQTLTAVSPVDGRYARHSAPLRAVCSEFGLIRYRVLVEVHWLQHLARHPDITELPAFDIETEQYLHAISTDFTLADAERVKAIEATTNHDVKAVEYFLQERLETHDILQKAIPFIHFACTSEDINNLAYALMLRDARARYLVPLYESLNAKLGELARQCQHDAMLSRTHGQAATPTTMGKEIANLKARLDRQIAQLRAVEILGKFNGAVGNFNAHVVAYPDVDWPRLSDDFVASLGLTANRFTTQIEPHDYIAELFGAVQRANTVLIDFCRDVWSYISIGYFRQKLVAGEVGSSTMPHKINPIDFENAEGNFGVANALSQHLANKLPVSRWQRDLTDSTVLRNIGSALAYTLIGLNACIRGVDKLEPDQQQQTRDLENAWEVLAEALQTVMRRHGDANAYETLKTLTRGHQIDRASLHRFIDSLALPDVEKDRLKELTPRSYTGLAANLTNEL